jgi:hypothetical protein
MFNLVEKARFFSTPLNMCRSAANAKRTPAAIPESIENITEKVLVKFTCQGDAVLSEAGTRLARRTNDR